ncbi:MAG: FIST N-terminal domain-containing protein [Thermodesulfobacteriota bacterium]|nr:FIST N-terminal domain-containing protein [Thermodesulfobacteriota bacterium]
MEIKTICSTKKTIGDVIIDIKEQSGDFDAKMAIFFASSKFGAESLSNQLSQVFEGASVFGCSTAGEIVSGKMLKGSVVLMLFAPEVIADVKLGVVENIRTENMVPEVFKNFEDYYKTPMSEMDFKKYVGIILIDGLSGAEERLMDKIGNLTDITFVGASAGDDKIFKETYVYADGKSYTNAALLALIKPAADFDIIKTQSFRRFGKKLTATKVDEANRRVVEFNNQPAAKAYTEALGIPLEDAENHFMTYPVGLMSGGEPYVRSPQQVQEDGSIVFYCNIIEGMELEILESTDIVEDTRRDVETKINEIGSISGIINFHCILRTLELEEKGQVDDYAKIFSDIPTVGFSTYGEEYIGHVNQTSTMLVFK